MTYLSWPSAGRSPSDTHVAGSGRRSILKGMCGRLGAIVPICLWSGSRLLRTASTSSQAFLRPGPAPAEGFWQAEVEIKKSKFIARLAPCKTLAEGRQFKKEVSDFRASHNCWAAIDLAGSMGSSDDGEPAGTAGMPMRSVLERAGYRGASVVVTRYYGGIKLGTGGLVRAYTECCQAVTKEVEWLEFQKHTCLEVLDIAPSQTATLYRLTSDGNKLGATMSTDVCYDLEGNARVILEVPEKDEAALKSALIDAGMRNLRTVEENELEDDYEPEPEAEAPELLADDVFDTHEEEAEYEVQDAQEANSDDELAQLDAEERALSEKENGRRESSPTTRTSVAEVGPETLAPDGVLRVDEVDEVSKTPPEDRPQSPPAKKGLKSKLSRPPRRTAT
eukprot:TRINITY_DN56500_c0_g1_i2.p1 TRINITY_DN56500_c0_g1~~TRINITY_DN56500_c0_g1_i2.p1  ORF type:complete len:392 (+),score=68.75 TRINITY_DN56500_c0_g1_i2:196-1371(+)